MSESLPTPHTSEQPSLAGELRLILTDNHSLSDEALEQKAAYWTEKLNAPETSERAADDIAHLIERILFELGWRNGDYTPTQVPDFVPEEWE